MSVIKVGALQDLNGNTEFDLINNSISTTTLSTSNLSASKLTIPSIGTGSSGQVLQTDGAGNLSWANLIEAGALYYRLGSPFVGSNTTSPQSLFGVGVTLASNTTYIFTMSFGLSRSGSAGSLISTLGLGFTGTGIISNIYYVGNGPYDDTNALGANGSIGANNASFIGRTSSNFTIVTLVATNGFLPGYFAFNINGTLTTGTGGTFIPQYKLNALPGSTNLFSTIQGSYIRLVPIGTSSGNISQGSWA